MEEIWKPLEGYEGLYSISNFGNIISHAKEWSCGDKGTIRRKPETILKQTIGSGDYHRVTIRKNKEMKCVLVHHLVWDNFNGTKRDDKEIDHIDNNKSNNHIDNLQLLTPRENSVKSIEQRGRKVNNHYSGIHKDKRRTRGWYATVRINNKRKKLPKMFLTEEEAYNYQQNYLKEKENGN